MSTPAGKGAIIAGATFRFDALRNGRILNSVQAGEISFVMEQLRKGMFVTFEGIDGCGKSTQAAMAVRLLTSLGYKVELLREPGSTAVSERIRKLLLDKRLEISDMTELLLYEAARAEITATEIKPMLARKYIVMCDRFYDSTTAYQGFGRRLDIRMVRSLNKMAVGNLVPDLTLLFDLDLATAAKRRAKTPDRLEGQSNAFHSRVRSGFLELARRERRRIKVVDASSSIDKVFSEVSKLLLGKLKRYASSRTP